MTIVRLLVLMLVGVLISPHVWAAEPAKNAPKELIGPIRPSIMVPPVRTQPPSRTPEIVRPAQYDAKTQAHKRTLTYRMESLRLAIEDLCRTFGDQYPQGPAFVKRWDALSKDISANAPDGLSRFRLSLIHI